MSKSATFARLTGAVSGPTAPAPYRRYGGPLLATAIQGGLLAGGGHLAGGLLYRGDDEEGKRRAARRGALMGAAAGIGLNLPQLIVNKRRYGWGGLNMTPERAIERGLAGTPKAGSLGYTGYAGIYGQPRIPPNPPQAMSMRYTPRMIASDPYLTPGEKIQTIQALLAADTGQRGFGHVTAGDIARAGVGGALGYAGASILGRALGTVFGGLPPSMTKALQTAGVAAGALRNTGVWR